MSFIIRPFLIRVGTLWRARVASAVATDMIDELDDLAQAVEVQ